MRKCILEKGKICDDCGKCDSMCDLDPSKACDNCCKCIENGGEYLTLDLVKYANRKRKALHGKRKINNE